MDLGFRGDFRFLDKHYERTGFDLIFANEINPQACHTYRTNLGDHIVEGDIWSVIDKIPVDVDVVIGGFPCQDISVNGKGAGLEGKRSGLYRAMVETVRRIKPRAFVAENVKGLLMKHHRSALEQVLSDFGNLGYVVNHSLYCAADYGVPQTRDRVFIVGMLPELGYFTPPSITNDKKARITAKAALKDLASEPESTEFSHIWSRARRSPEQGDRRLLANRPGYTIRAECHGNIQWHYELPRRISMREAARLQSFPDKFQFTGGLRNIERQVGNAVPPVLAWHIARQLQTLLS